MGLLVGLPTLLILLAWMPIPATGVRVVLSRLLGIRLPHIILWRPLLWWLLIRRLLPRRLLPWLLWKLLRGTTLLHFAVTVLPYSAALRVSCRGTSNTARYWSAQVHAGRFRRDPLLVA